jgi:ferredoxin
MKIRVDSSRCQGHTLCSMIAPKLFTLNDNEGHASAVTEDVPPEHQGLAREAPQSCPEQAILIEGMSQ